MATWYSDEGFHSDEQSHVVMGSTSELSVTLQGVSYPLSDRQLEASVDFEIYVLAAVALDLMKLLPEKFHNSQILKDFLYEAGLQVGNWFTKVREIVKLLNVRSINDIRYLRYLGALIGVEFPPEDEITVDDAKKNIINAIDWYKIKGTYRAVAIIALIQKFAINVYDLWTNDYINFIPVAWFVGSDGESPIGLDSSYYKSPHFGIEVVLNKIYTPGPGLGDYLWVHGYINNLLQKIEEIRPAHTVPHYVLLLNPKTDEFGNIITVEGNIKTKTAGNWEHSTRYLDETANDKIWYTDTGVFLDESATSFIKSIIKWKLGNGGMDVSDSGFDISEVLTGSIDPDNIIISNEKITFDFTVPKTYVADGINELSLCIPGSPDITVVTSSFPKIDKDNNVTLRIIVEVYRKDLS